MELCSPDEEIVRAVQSAHIDLKNGRVSSDLFKGTNNSVSRLKILPLNEIFRIFRKTLHNPPRVSLICAGKISVETLQTIGNNYQYPITITVRICPTKNNPAHAEIPQKITSGLARQIVKALQFYDQNCQELSVDRG